MPFTSWNSKTCKPDADITLARSRETANPVVYSRNGRLTYGSRTKTDPEGVTFGVRDLQTRLGQAVDWRWNFRPQPYYLPADEADRTLVFESRFESGNLGLAVKVSDWEYKLVLQNDALTLGNTQCTTRKVSLMCRRVLLPSIEYKEEPDREVQHNKLRKAQREITRE